MVLLPSNGTPHVNLPDDGGGDQRDPALLQQVDGAFGFCGECVEFGEFVLWK
jgi:hypothetical protein